MCNQLPGLAAIYGMLLGRSVRFGLMENQCEDYLHELCCLGQQHNNNCPLNKSIKHANGESFLASVSKLLTRASPVALPHQTNLRTSIQGDAALCAR